MLKYFLFSLGKNKIPNCSKRENPCGYNKVFYVPVIYFFTVSVGSLIMTFLHFGYNF